ncbi:MAG: hypothetical protein ACI3WR_04040 [Oscillospiraceae bacterium]
MTDYESLYFHLFAAAADAVEALERLDIGTAKDILVRAQQEAEEQYLAEEE